MIYSGGQGCGTSRRYTRRAAEFAKMVSLFCWSADRWYTLRVEVIAMSGTTNNAKSSTFDDGAYDVVVGARVQLV